MGTAIKRGQAAAGAAVLLFIIAGLMIMFIVLLPPQERAELLDEDTTTDTTTSSNIVDGDVKKNLLKTSPGRIDYLAQDEIEHPLPAVNIFTKTETRVLAEKNIANVKKVVFSEETVDFTFSISDLDNTANALLTFNVVESTGDLIITLNGQEIYQATPNLGGVQPINLPKNLLQEENLITFSASSPGIAFWRTHKTSLKNIKVVADVKSVDAQTSRSVFLVSETEMQSLERIFLKFYPNCGSSDQGKLIIRINGRELYSAIPDCSVGIAPIEFSPEFIHLGENEVVFHSEKGMYLLTNVMVESELKEVDFPTFYFDLANEEYDDVEDGDLDLRLQMDFVDVVTRKKGDLVFNGDVKRFDTKEVTLTMDLSEDIDRGTNSIKIKPKKTLEIRELRVDLVE